MSEYITVVLKYEKGQKKPRFGAGMEVLGGNVDSVQFDHALVEFEKMDDELSRTKADLEEAKIVLENCETFLIGIQFDPSLQGHIEEAIRKKHEEIGAFLSNQSNSEE